MDLIQCLPKGFDVLMGHEPAYQPGLACGVKGCISGIANAFPEMFVKLYDSMMAKEYEEGKRYQEIIMKVALLLYKNNRNLTNYKEVLHWGGLKRNYTRPPLHRNSHEEAEHLRKSLDELFQRLGLELLQS